MATLFTRAKEKIRMRLPWPFLYAYRELRSLPQDFPYIFDFLFHRTKTPSSFFDRLKLVAACYRISYSVECPHMENEMIQVMQAIFSMDPSVPGVIVEAGSYKGGSGAKISRAARLSGRELYLFDSFEGIPPHEESHGKNIYGGDAYFPPGSYKGALEEVKESIGKYGVPGVCKFAKGWFDDTMPSFSQRVAVAYVDVDLQSSTATCLKYLYPLLSPGGVIFSQDGHLPWVVKLLDDRNFWIETVKTQKPSMKGLGIKKLVAVFKSSK